MTHAGRSEEPPRTGSRRLLTDPVVVIQLIPQGLIVGSRKMNAFKRFIDGA